ncbi:MAG: beta-N-acetylhexosaminidase [Acidobacteria bacterium]|nr:MAG: beta-N-acetylhexosaminidase [Acidobacteriota bacterium]
MRDSLRRVGQRFMIGFDGFEASADAKRLIRDYGVGHVILFARNVASPEQVAELVRELQECARRAGHETPLPMAVDQEGGRVARLGPPWTVWPPLRALGRIGEPDLARRMGAALAAECSAAGIKCDFAPIMDVDTNPDNPIIGNRAFGDDPDLVARLGVAMIEGLQGGGVVASAKHFPGHGDTSLDSHLALPVVEHSRSRLEDVEMRPFRAAIKAKVATIMMAHVLYPELDPEVPASLSKPIVEGILRGDLKYDGVVFTDDLEMKAVADRWTPDRAAVMAMQAGCDIVPVCLTHDAQVTAMEGAVRAAETGELPFRGMDDALARVRRLKERYLLPYRDPDPRQARQAAGAPEFVALAQEISERGSEPLRFPWTSD